MWGLVDGRSFPCWAADEKRCSYPGSLATNTQPCACAGGGAGGAQAREPLPPGGGTQLPGGGSALCLVRLGWRAELRPLLEGDACACNLLAHPAHLRILQTRLPEGRALNPLLGKLGKGSALHASCIQAIDWQPLHFPAQALDVSGKLWWATWMLPSWRPKRGKGWALPRAHHGPPSHVYHSYGLAYGGSLNNL